MLTQHINVKLEGNLWVAFQLFAERVIPAGVNKKTPAVFIELIKETPEYSKIMGIPAVQEQPAPAENPTPKDNDTDPKNGSQ